MALDPIDYAAESTLALNVIAAVRRNPGMTAAEIVDYLNDTLMPDDPLDNREPYSLDYVDSGIAKAGALLTESAGEYSLTSPDQYVQRVAGGADEIELVPTGRALRKGYMW
jgi:hypothetical protein